MTTTNTTARLIDYNTGRTIRPATTEELIASVEAATHDGGVGAILVDLTTGRIVRPGTGGCDTATTCWVDGE
jgi:hypothetical protein